MHIVVGGTRDRQGFRGKQYIRDYLCVRIFWEKKAILAIIKEVMRK